MGGAALRYIDWLFPGILGMNTGVQLLVRRRPCVVLRYRKSGFLKRLPHATPLTALGVSERASRFCRTGALILFVTAVLYGGIAAIIGFHNARSHSILLLLAILPVIGALDVIALGLHLLLVRFSSEEARSG